MHLRALTLKGFKSFPERTRLDFGPGVSVVVGPNGSGKSNVTDAVLWAMGEQSPSTIRGQSMQDVIFGGGRGVQARSAAEVEIVLDNCDGTVALPLSEISIVRRLDRSGEGEYRLNGARCRLADVIEVLSDTGLGKESHSVISQGRVEAIVTSKPRERRLLIEEAAGLGKHRRRRRRAQLKLARTEENLDRALDVEREARSRLRPLKRQAEAAELHQRLELQTLQARLQLALDTARAKGLQLRDAEQRAASARQALSATEQRLKEVSCRRAAAEQALSERAQHRDQLSRLLYGARTSEQRLEMRAEQADGATERLRARMKSTAAELRSLTQSLQRSSSEDQPSSRLQQLELALEQLEREQELALERELRELSGECEKAAGATEQARLRVDQARRDRDALDAEAEAAATALREAEREAQEARRAAAEVGAELAAANQFLRSHASAFSKRSGGASAARQDAEGRRSHDGGDRGAAGLQQVHALGELIEVQEGCELALAAALGARFDAALVQDLGQARELLDLIGAEGGTALVADRGADAPAGAPAGAQAPSDGAQRLIELVTAPQDALSVLRVLLAGAWLVDRIEVLPEDFEGIAVTREGRVWSPSLREMRQVVAGGADLLLAKRNERERLLGATEQAAAAEQGAKLLVEERLRLLADARARRDAADGLMREHERALADCAEEERRQRSLLQKRRRAPEEGPLAVRKAQLSGELAAERRQAERARREQEARALLVSRLQAQMEADSICLPVAERLLDAIAQAHDAVNERSQELAGLLEQDRQAGEQMACQLRECALQEADIQAALRTEAESVTTAEVGAQRLRDQVQEAQVELEEVARRLEIDVPSPQDAHPLEQEAAQALTSRVEKLNRRREQLGPVNPLAQEEYQQALSHVEELESRRADLETALRELRTVIRDADRQIKQTFEETFAAASANFEQLVGDVFPGGSGRLRLVAEGQAIKQVLGGQADQVDGQGEQQAEAEADTDTEDEDGGEDLEGVEIEITPAGKSTKQLSLLSGGEKSMTALAFLFAVFLARPCPFYILDEVEAALDDLNLDRFLTLLRRYADRAQFIVITHQKRTMEAADWLYGVSMGGDGVSKVISRRLPSAQSQPEELEPTSEKRELSPELGLEAA